jgi:geranylgeranyl diphosphate synthase type I
MTLSKNRRGLAREVVHDYPWPLLPLYVCEAVSGRYERALPAAAALQFLTAAGDVFDDIEDQDSSISLSTKYGTALATNVASTLLVLAWKAIAGLKEKGVENNIIVQVMERINSFCIAACVGQHLDINLTTMSDVSEDSYFKVISMKSASQVECACQVGALLGTSNQKLIDIFTKFGHELGMAAQITNDIQGVTQGNDIMKHKITLPIIYALTQTDDEIRNQFELLFRKPSESSPDITQIRELLFRTGAIHYATVKMELYKQKALDILATAKIAVASEERLKQFLE